MRPEDITEQDENGKIKDTEGQLAADENRNETVEIGRASCRERV